MRIAENQTLLLGPPGTGKTTRIMEMIERDLETVAPEKIALVSFTKKAVNEAVDRACEKFGLQRNRFLLFQTIHSLCFRQLGATRQSLMTKQNYEELGKLTGYRLDASINMEDGTFVLPDADKGSKLLFLDNFARITRQTLFQAWKNANPNIPFDEVVKFSTKYSNYKLDNGLMDFTDLLDVYIREGLPAKAEIVYVDEAQDLSRAQWEVLQRCFATANKVIIAGDDDQSIFKWAGADLKTFLALEGEPEVLAHSYRLPRKVFNKAQAIVKRLKQRLVKDFTPRDAEGSIGYASNLEEIKLNPDEKTLILVRNVYLLAPVYEYLQQRAIPFTGRNNFASVLPEHIKAISSWEVLRRGDVIPLANARMMYEYLRVGDILDRGGKTRLNNADEGEIITFEALRDNYGLKSLPVWYDALLGIPADRREYYRSVMRSGKTLSGECNVHVNTIHGVKGGEADHVVVLSDMSKKTFDEMQKDPCSEHRVAFVAVTRAREKLTVVFPKGRFSYAY